MKLKFKKTRSKFVIIVITIYHPVKIFLTFSNCCKRVRCVSKSNQEFDINSILKLVNLLKFFLRVIKLFFLPRLIFFFFCFENNNVTFVIFMPFMNHDDEFFKKIFKKPKFYWIDCKKIYLNRLSIKCTFIRNRINQFIEL